jgi:hypothetical protein
MSFKRVVRRVADLAPTIVYVTPLATGLVPLAEQNLYPVRREEINPAERATHEIEGAHPHFSTETTRMLTAGAGASFGGSSDTSVYTSWTNEPPRSQVVPRPWLPHEDEGAHVHRSTESMRANIVLDGGTGTSMHTPGGIGIRLEDIFAPQYQPSIYTVKKV